MTKFTFKLTQEQSQLVVDALSAMPFARVFELINEIRSQASNQLIAAQAPKVEPIVEAQEKTEEAAI